MEEKLKKNTTAYSKIPGAGQWQNWVSAVPDQHYLNMSCGIEPN